MSAAATARRLVRKPLRRVIVGRNTSPRRLPFGIGRGLRVEIDPTSPLDMYLGLYEFEIAKHIEELCKPGYLCFDIGGFDGYYALILSRLTSEKVIVFEADPDSCARVRRNCDANPMIGDRVEIENAYVGFETNVAEKCIALDDKLDSGQLPLPDFIKMDVDRAELSALTGAKKLLAARRPHLIVEVHSAELERQCADLLVELGYAPRIVTQRKWLPENRPLEHCRWIVARGQEPG
jgi:Methyltransferase FkbM domain